MSRKDPTTIERAIYSTYFYELSVDNVLDRDGDVCFQIGDEMTWVRYNNIPKLIEHLQQVLETSHD